MKWLESILELVGGDTIVNNGDETKKQEEVKIILWSVKRKEREKHKEV